MKSLPILLSLIVSAPALTGEAARKTSNKKGQPFITQRALAAKAAAKARRSRGPGKASKYRKKQVRPKIDLIKQAEKILLEHIDQHRDLKTQFGIGFHRFGYVSRAIINARYKNGSKDVFETHLFTDTEPFEISGGANGFKALIKAAGFSESASRTLVRKLLNRLGRKTTSEKDIASLRETTSELTQEHIILHLSGKLRVADIQNLNRTTDVSETIRLAVLTAMNVHDDPKNKKVKISGESLGHRPIKFQLGQREVNAMLLELGVSKEDIILINSTKKVNADYIAQDIAERSHPRLMNKLSEEAQRFINEQGDNVSTDSTAETNRLTKKDLLERLREAQPVAGGSNNEYVNFRFHNRDGHPVIIHSALEARALLAELGITGISVQTAIISNMMNRVEIGPILEPYISRLSPAGSATPKREARIVKNTPRLQPETKRQSKSEHQPEVKQQAKQKRLVQSKKPLFKFVAKDNVHIRNFAKALNERMPGQDHLTLRLGEVKFNIYDNNTNSMDLHVNVFGDLEARFVTKGGSTVATRVSDTDFTHEQMNEVTSLIRSNDFQYKVLPNIFVRERVSTTHNLHYIERKGAPKKKTRSAARKWFQKVRHDWNDRYEAQMFANTGMRHLYRYTKNANERKMLKNKLAWLVENMRDRHPYKPSKLLLGLSFVEYPNSEEVSTANVVSKINYNGEIELAYYDGHNGAKGLYSIPVNRKNLDISVEETPTTTKPLGRQLIDVIMGVDNFDLDHIAAYKE